MSHMRSPGQGLLLTACAAGVSCLALLATPLPPLTAQSSGGPTPAAANDKNSPYAASQDETTDPDQDGAAMVPDQMKGDQTTGSSKNSPFAGAKETNREVHQELRVDRRRGWLLLVPVSLAALSYAGLKSQERGHG